MTPRGRVWSSGGRWWYRIERPGWVEEQCPHSFDTPRAAYDACLSRMAYLADPLGYALRSQLAMIRNAMLPRVFEVWEQANRAKRAHYALAGPAEGA